MIFIDDLAVTDNHLTVDDYRLSRTLTQETILPGTTLIAIADNLYFMFFVPGKHINFIDSCVHTFLKMISGQNIAFAGYHFTSGKQECTVIRINILLSNHRTGSNAS